MASVKVKFRPSTIEGKTGALYFTLTDAICPPPYRALTKD